MLRPEPFEQVMFRPRVREEWFGQPLWLATPEDVILHRLSWNRIAVSDRPMGDVAGVVAVQQGRLDEAYRRLWADHLEVRTMLAEVLRGQSPPKSS